jgi:hypothetical protein
MRRRQFLKLMAGGVTAMGLRAPSLLGQAAPSTMPAQLPMRSIEGYFLQILQGFLKNAATTSPTYTTCDFPGGTKLKGCCTPSGKTYVSVARMLPAMSEWIASGRQRVAEFEAKEMHWVVDGRERLVEIDERKVDLGQIVMSIFRTAFDPKHPDYWGPAPADKPSQRCVEAAMVAWSLWRMEEPFIQNLGAEARSNIQNWLANCTQIPERTSNHAWFTAINQAVRLELSRKFPEFHGDEAWMLEDLKALDGLYEEGNDGWYSDSPDLPVFDYYNFFVFPNFPLYWGQVIGNRYPDWNVKFRRRVAEFLQTTPWLFDSRGAHPLYGRSLIYRWGVLSPLVLGYREGIWPHSPGLLRRIVRKSLEYHWSLGAFDENLGKLRETYSADGSPAIRENYIDNGHPYWCMLAFSVLSIPPSDPFWTDEEEPFPVEKRDFAQRLEGPRMMLIGVRRSGEVKWLHARPSTRRDYYRDKYEKFVYSSHFPFNVITDKDRCPWDQMLVFRDKRTGACAGRLAAESGELTRDGARTVWSAQLGQWTFHVTTTVQINGEFETRAHAITAPRDAIDHVELIEGSYALGLGRDDKYDSESGQRVRSIRSGEKLLVTWNVAGYEALEIADHFGQSGDAPVNIVYPRMAVISLMGKVMKERLTLVSAHYASARALPLAEVMQRGRELVARWSE